MVCTGRHLLDGRAVEAGDSPWTENWRCGVSQSTLAVRVDAPREYVRVVCDGYTVLLTYGDVDHVQGAQVFYRRRYRTKIITAAIPQARPIPPNQHLNMNKYARNKQNDT